MRQSLFLPRRIENGYVQEKRKGREEIGGGVRKALCKKESGDCCKELGRGAKIAQRIRQRSENSAKNLFRFHAEQKALYVAVGTAN